METQTTPGKPFFETLQKTSWCRLNPSNQSHEGGPTVNEDVELEVRSLAELAAGEEIEAWHRGRLAHRGKVVSTLDGIDLFWIIDSRTGARRLLDLEQLSVRRLTPRKPRAAVGKPGPPPRRAAIVPVFLEAQ
jgi:hypothetical protein